MKAIILISVLAIVCGVLPIVYSKSHLSVLTDDSSEEDRDGVRKGEDDNSHDEYDEYDEFENDSYEYDEFESDSYEYDEFENDGYEYDEFESDGYKVNGYKNDGYKVNGYKNDRYKNHGYNVDGYTVDGYKNRGYKNRGYKVNGYGRASIDQDIRDEQGNLILADPNLRIDYLLYTRKNKMNPKFLVPEKITDRFIHGTAHKGTIFIFNGFTSSVDDEWVQNMKEELLEFANFNVIVVDWRKETQPTWTNHVQAAKNTKIVGQRTANLIKAMENQKGIGASKMHLIGHGLGAHCAGYTGKRLLKMTGYKPSRISGLDPTGSLFANSKATERLDISDAVFVDIIHTNAGDWPELGWKKNSPLGHVDFYPNGGSTQLGCSMNDHKCNHGRAPLLYVSSFRKCEYQSRPGAAVCPAGPDTVRMGYYAETVTDRLQETYCLETTGTPPYCRI